MSNFAFSILNRKKNKSAAHTKNKDSGYKIPIAAGE